MPSRRYDYESSNPLGLSPPSSDDEGTYRSRRGASSRAPPTSYRAFGESGRGSLSRSGSISSARQSQSSRARSHSQQSHDIRSSSRSAYDSLRSMNSFDRGDDNHYQSSGLSRSRTLRPQASRQFEPDRGTDLSSYDNHYGSRHGSISHSRSASRQDSSSTIRPDRRDSHSQQHSRSGSRADQSYDISSASGMPLDIHSEGIRNFFNRRRQGQYYGSREDHQNVSRSLYGSSQKDSSSRYGSSRYDRY